jgi:hypothetical protein
VKLWDLNPVPPARTPPREPSKAVPPGPAPAAVGGAAQDGMPQPAARIVP